ncbi:Calcipressin [Fennellomyces sp. T-0311]|nr:Calcipressin [Fennellomyces sp. T-0311]
MQANSIATNTLLMPNVPSTLFNYPISLEQVRVRFDDVGVLYAFVAMKGFGRLMIIYEETAAAIKARETIDKTILSWQEHSESSGVTVTDINIGNDIPSDRRPWMEIRLYYGQHNPINPDPKTFQLQVPQSEKNFLISPPGSPCDDWKQTMESPPNTAVLASDMTHAIAELSDDDVDDLENFRLESPVLSDEETEPRRRSSGNSKRPTLKIVNSSGNHPDSEHLPSITVQDWDGHEAEEKPPKRSKFPKAQVIPTARPPVST